MVAIVLPFVVAAFLMFIVYAHNWEVSTPSQKPRYWGLFDCESPQWGDVLDAAGVDWDTIKDIVGHSTKKMSKAYRSKPDMKRLSVALEQMSGMLTVGDG
jgi:hypothetical protein